MQEETLHEETLGLEGSVADWARETVQKLENNKRTPEMLDKKINELVEEKRRLRAEGKLNDLDP